MAEVSEADINAYLDAVARNAPPEYTTSPYSLIERLRMAASRLAGGNWSPESVGSSPPPRAVVPALAQQSAGVNKAPPVAKNQPPAAKQQARRSGPAVALKPALLDQALADVLAQQKVMHDAEVQTQGPEISKLGETYAERNAKIKPLEVNPYGPSLARFMSLLGASGLANRGNVGKAMGETMPKYYESIDKEKELAEKAADKQRAQLVQEMLFGAQDLDSRNAGTKFTNEKLIRMAGITDPTKINDIRKAMVADQRAQEQIRVQREAANKNPFIQSVEYLASIKDPAKREAAHAMLTKDRGPVEHKFNQAEAEQASTAFRAMLRGAKDKDVVAGLEAEFAAALINKTPRDALQEAEANIKRLKAAGRL